MLISTGTADKAEITMIIADLAQGDSLLLSLTRPLFSAQLVSMGSYSFSIHLWQRSPP